MSYLALARKWRPTRFNEVVGQSHVLTALENALTQNRLHHAYLFSGTRGVGKTSIARLFAKGLNCETGITANPCGQCATCREIDQGRFVDLLEIDAASRTKVEDTRELLDNVQYKPARGRFKVYLIDEVHMLSRHSFNALLKTLEEPPEYVKFLLATTDPQKLPVTILSRCLQFHLKPIGVETISQQLEHILTQEQITSEPRALAMLAHAADGSMRDALSLTDQAIALGNGQVHADTVTHMLGTLDTDQALNLLVAIGSYSTQTVMDTIHTFAENGVEWDGLLQQLATQLHRIAMVQALPSSLDKELPDADKVRAIADMLSPQDVQLYYQIALKGRQDLPLSPTARIGIEMIVLRMMAFRPASVTAQAIVAQPDRAAVTSMPLSNSGVESSVAPAQTQPSTPAPQQPAYVPPAKTPMPNTAVPPNVGGAVSQPVPEQQSVPVESPVPQQAPNQASTEPRHSQIGSLRHQLRSQRKGLAAKGENGAKKGQATSDKPTTVIERVAQRGQISQPAQVSPEYVYDEAGAEQDDVIDERDYQWRFSQPEKHVEKKSELTPTQLKRALEHEKTPAMAEKLAQESIEQNEWAALIAKTDTAKLVEQLALNSFYRKDGSSIELVLRPSHAHLNNDKAQSELLHALNDQLEEECHLTVTIGEDGETPLELRERLYQGKLSQAMDSLASDPNVHFIEQRFQAVLDKDSVRPV
ncbi:DNA polymerase III subunit gamma/tau [Vibrio tritonius]|uniref:DNA polymerase III subunit gamma/tau n=1 Tax=Vibrio tritonius TaxID=1435069 RepID=A0ABS7YIJ9_9VIBR|nr:DNA polymerase III subunit gamma/tau [Vibrio tritonius]MCA2015481.1 DNA polymerase III subunit gamma/tau [Vibrio tritonius]